MLTTPPRARVQFGGGGISAARRPKIAQMLIFPVEFHQLRGLGEQFATRLRGKWCSRVLMVPPRARVQFGGGGTSAARRPKIGQMLIFPVEFQQLRGLGEQFATRLRGKLCSRVLTAPPRARVQFGGGGISAESRVTSHQMQYAPKSKKLITRAASHESRVSSSNTRQKVRNSFHESRVTSRVPRVTSH